MKYVIVLFISLLSQAALALEVLVVDQATQKGLNRAEVLVEPVENKRKGPYFTDADGKVSIDLSAEKSDVFTITTYIDGYHLLSLVDVSKSAPRVTLRLSPHIQKIEKAELNGTVSGYGSLPDDGMVDATLATTTPSLLDFVALDKDRFLAPNVPFKVAMFTFQIPGNIDIPRQRETYEILPVTLDKPGFKLFPPAHTQLRLIGLHAKIPFTQAINVFQQKKGIADLINNIRFQELAVTETQSFSGAAPTKLTFSMPFQKDLRLKTLTLQTNWDRVYASVINWNKESREWVPMDMYVHMAGRTGPNELKLNGLKDKTLGHQEKILVAQTAFPDNMEQPLPAIKVSGYLMDSSSVLMSASDEFLPIGAPKTLSATGMEWDMSAVPGKIREPQVQIHSLVINPKDGLSWIVVMAPSKRQFNFDAWPNNWPVRQFQAGAWSQTLLGTTAPVMISDFNMTEISKTITHASFQKTL